MTAVDDAIREITGSIWETLFTLPLQAADDAVVREPSVTGCVTIDGAWHGARHLEDLDPAEEIGRLAGERAVAKVNPQKPKAGRYPILFDPRVAGSILTHFAAAISGGASWITGSPRSSARQIRPRL